MAHFKSTRLVRALDFGFRHLAEEKKNGYYVMGLSELLWPAYVALGYAFDGEIGLGG